MMKRTKQSHLKEVGEQQGSCEMEDYYQLSRGVVVVVRECLEQGS